MTILTAAQVEAIRARAAAATPGGWRHTAVAGGWDGVTDCDGDGGLICTLTLNHPPNASFIAAARTDIPALVASLTAAREAARKLADALDGPSSCQVCRFGYSTFNGKRVPRHSDTCELVALRAALGEENAPNV